jgi:hypothetical protein
MIETGKIPVSWSDNDYIDFEFSIRIATPDNNIFEFVNDEDSNRYFTGCWYTNNANIKEKLKLKNYFENLTNVGYAVHKMDPGQILPYHKDHYTKYKNLYNIKNIDSIKRIIVFLRDWNPGELLGVEEKIFTNWKAGDWVSWTGHTTHIAANLGHKERYTLQITGVKE